MPLLDLFWAMLWFFLWIAWIWLLVMIFFDLFRSRDLSGWAKALWALFIVLLPFLGVFIYLIVRGQSMGERSMQEAAEREQRIQEYVRSAADSGTSTADEIEKFARLRNSGALTDEEFQAQKARLLATEEVSSPDRPAGMRA